MSSSQRPVVRFVVTWGITWHFDLAFNRMLTFLDKQNVHTRVCLDSAVATERSDLLITPVLVSLMSNFPKIVLRFWKYRPFVNIWLRTHWEALRNPIESVPVFWNLPQCWVLAVLLVRLQYVLAVKVSLGGSGHPLSRNINVCIPAAWAIWDEHMLPCRGSKTTSNSNLRNSHVSSCKITEVHQKIEKKLI